MYMVDPDQPAEDLEAVEVVDGQDRAPLVLVAQETKSLYNKQLRKEIILKIYRRKRKPTEIDINRERGEKRDRKFFSNLNQDTVILSFVITNL